MTSVRCYSCGAEIEYAGDATPDDAPRLPQVGDLVVCWHCGAVAIFDRELRVRWLREDQLTLLSARSQGIVAALRRRIVQ